MIQSTVCSQDPEPRVLDGWQDSMELPPSMQFEPLCRTTQHLECRNHRSNDWQTNRLIPRPGHILLHWVFLRLRIPIEERFFPCLFFFGPFPCLCSWYNPYLLLCRAGKGENPPSWKPSLPFDKPFLPFFPLDHPTWSSSCHHSGSCACSSPKNALPVLLDRPLPFPFPFPFLLFTRRPLNGLYCHAGTLSVVPCPET